MVKCQRLSLDTASKKYDKLNTNFIYVSFLYKIIINL